VGDEKSDAKPGADGGKAEVKPPEPPSWLPLPKDLRDFLDCTRDNVKLADSGLDTAVKGVTAGFAAAKKKGHFKITIKGLRDKMSLDVPDPLELDASIDKDGKLHIHVRDRTDLPQPIKDGIRSFVHAVNRFMAGKGKKVGPPETTKDGKLALEKVAVTAALLEKEAGNGFLAHLPTGEKVGGAVAMVALLVLSIALVGAGDSTTTATKDVAVGGSGGSGGSGPETPPVPGPPAEGLAQQVRDVYIRFEGREPTEGTLTPLAGETLEFEVPLFRIGVQHMVELWGQTGNVVDSFALTPPELSGTVQAIATDQGGTVDCAVDHETPVPPGASGAKCAYHQPVPAPTQQAAPAPGDATVEPPSSPTATTVTTTEETDTPPYLPVGGLALAAAVIGGLVVDDDRRRRIAIAGGVAPGFLGREPEPARVWGLGTEPTIDEAARTLHDQWADKGTPGTSEYDLPLSTSPPGKGYSDEAYDHDQPDHQEEQDQGPTWDEYADDRGGKGDPGPGAPGAAGHEEQLGGGTGPWFHEGPVVEPDAEPDPDKPQLPPAEDLRPKPYRPPPEVM
jgi:hypothetical protein